MLTANAAITVVIPVFNGERFIGAAIDSVMRQSVGEFEIIVVDDGSTDQSESICKRYGKLVRYQRQNHKGPAAARSLGVELGAGDFFAFLDCDDLWHTDKTAVQLARFQERPGLAGCVAHVQNFLSDDYENAGTFSQEFLEKPLLTFGSTFMARRSLFEAVGSLDADYQHRDIQDLIVRATDRGLLFDTLPDVLAQRRIHSTNMSHSRDGQDQLELVSITRARHARRRAVGT